MVRKPGGSLARHPLRVAAEGLRVSEQIRKEKWLPRDSWSGFFVRSD